MDLSDILIEFLDVILLLLAKFWYVIIGFLGYLLLGKSKDPKKRRQPAFPPVLTPTHDGGFPPPNQASPEAKQELEMDQRDFGEATWTASPQDGEKEENQPFIMAAEPLGSIEQEKGGVRTVPQSGIKDPASVESKQVQQPIDAREGMKWALIFSPPRAKDPYKPPYLQAKKN